MRQMLAVFAIVTICIFGISTVVQAQVKAPDTVILKGNPLGSVKFNHAAHAKLAGDKCETCHHASKPEKAAKAAQEKCATCHAKAVTPPMKTPIKLAFHDGMAKKGICISCHTKEPATGKKVPIKCVDCHKKENK